MIKINGNKNVKYTARENFKLRHFRFLIQSAQCIAYQNPLIIAMTTSVKVFAKTGGFSSIIENIPIKKPILVRIAVAIICGNRFSHSFHSNLPPLLLISWDWLLTTSGIPYLRNFVFYLECLYYNFGVLYEITWDLVIIEIKPDHFFEISVYLYPRAKRLMVWIVEFIPSIILLVIEKE